MYILVLCNLCTFMRDNDSPQGDVRFNIQSNRTVLNRTLIGLIVLHRKHLSPRSLPTQHALCCSWQPSTPPNTISFSFSLQLESAGGYPWLVPSVLMSRILDEKRRLLCRVVDRCEVVASNPWIARIIFIYSGTSKKQQVLDSFKILHNQRRCSTKVALCEQVYK